MAGVRDLEKAGKINDLSKSRERVRRGEGRGVKSLGWLLAGGRPVLPHAQLCFFPVGQLGSSQACDKMLRSQFFVWPDGESSRIPVRNGGGEKQSAPAVESLLKSPKVFAASSSTYLRRAAAGRVVI